MISHNQSKLNQKRQRPIRANTEIKRKNVNNHHLPTLNRSMSKKLEYDLIALNQIFDKIKQERQNSGLIPLNLEDDDEIMDLPQGNFAYDPELSALNSRILLLRLQAQKGLNNLLKEAKKDVGFSKKLKKQLQKLQQERMETNEKRGRLGAMKAQKRLIDKQQLQIKRIQNLNFGDKALLKAFPLPTYK